jgi:hypothetical protein
MRDTSAINDYWKTGELAQGGYESPQHNANSGKRIEGFLRGN